MKGYCDRQTAWLVLTDLLPMLYIASSFNQTILDIENRSSSSDGTMIIHTKTNRFRYFWPRKVGMLVLLAGLAGCDQQENDYVAPPAPDVTYANPIEVDLTPFVDESGILEAASEAGVQARVRGYIKTIDFEPGEFIKKGQLLYTIEKDQYKAAVDSAEAVLETAKAAIVVAKADVQVSEAAVLKADQDLDREVRLKERGASSQAQYDAAVAAAAATKAELEAAKANVESTKSRQLQAEADLQQAEIDLAFTDIHAEIEGRISKTNLKVGNLVIDGTELATITDDRQVFANFSIGDRAALRLLNARNQAIEEIPKAERKTGRDAWSGAPVYMAREGDKGYLFKGELDNIDQSGIQVETGTLGLRAVFDNAQQQLIPGLFVALRVPAATSLKSLLVPEKAVLRSDQGTFLLVVNSENKIERLRSEVMQAVNGWAIVEGGVDTKSRVVVNGLQFARPGTIVVPSEIKYNIDADRLLRGMNDPEEASTTSPPVDAMPASENANAANPSTDA